VSATRPRGACTERNKERTSGAVEEAVISRELTSEAVHSLSITSTRFTS
jgi:hypothetical protein